MRRQKRRNFFTICFRYHSLSIPSHLPSLSVVKEIRNKDVEQNGVNFA